jgi:hypothetical protein
LLLLLMIAAFSVQVIVLGGELSRAKQVISS